MSDESGTEEGPRRSLSEDSLTDTVEWLTHHFTEKGSFGIFLITINADDGRPAAMTISNPRVSRDSDRFIARMRDVLDREIEDFTRQRDLERLTLLTETSGHA